MSDGTLRSEADLREIYRAPGQRSLDKEIDHLDEHCRDFIAHSPFLVLGTAGPERGADVSPKGGTPGFVAVLDDHRLAIPDMSGNNRLDSMRNIVGGGHAAALFMIPGVNETLRVNGRATISTDPEVLATCPINGMPANVAIVVEVRSAFIHCAKALLRSSLWSTDGWPDVSGLATPACMLKDHIGLDGSVEETQRRLDDSYAQTTWAMGGRAQE